MSRNNKGEFNTVPNNSYAKHKGLRTMPFISGILVGATGYHMHAEPTNKYKETLRPAYAHARQNQKNNVFGVRSMPIFHEPSLI